MIGKRFLKRLWKNSKGQSLVEFALVALLMVTILLGTIDMGLIFFQQSGLSSIAKDTARAASVGQTKTQIGDLIKKDSEMVLAPMNTSVSTHQVTVTGSDGSTITVEINPGLDQRKKGETIEVKVMYTYHPISFFLPASIDLTARSYTLVEETS